MPAICGVSPYQTALDVYLSKVNPVNPKAEKLSDNDPRRVGQIIEPTIARLYAERTGKRLLKAPSQSVHPALSWMNASLDYIHEDDHEPVDCKNTSKLEGWGEEGTDQVPYHIAIQMHHQMEVCGSKRAHVAAFFFGNTLKVYTIERDDQVAMQLIEIGNEFWQMVEDRTPPEPDWSHPATPKVIKKLYNRIEPRTVQLTDTERVMVEKYFEADTMAKSYSDQAEQLKAMLQASIGNAELAEIPGGYRMTRKSSSRKETVIPAYSFIDFRILRPSNAKKRKATRQKSVIVPDPVPNNDISEALAELSQVEDAVTKAESERF